MSQRQLQHLAAVVETRFRDHFDLSDVRAADPHAILRTRGLAALAVQIMTGEDAGAAAASVIDGFDDNGIDAIYLDEATPRLILVQSKWHSSGRSQRSINAGDAHKFIAGVRMLTSEQFDRFNGLLDGLAPRISAILRQPGLRIELVVATTGVQNVSDHVRQVFEDECRTANEPDEIMSFRPLRLADLYQYVLDTAAGASIDLTATVENWGLVSEPYEACYGTVPATQAAEWHRRFGDRLFDRNIRKALGMTQVNQHLLATLERESAHFWYYNNGITILCKQIKRAPVGSPQRRRGEFTLYGVSVVNGAQTVASIAEAQRRWPESVARARVWVRMISLERCPETFASDVTQANNTQNQVVDRDFVALDPNQDRLRQEFALVLGKTYVVKRGEETPTAEEGCTVDEATIALACAHPDTRYAVLARSNPGALWDRSERGRYDTVFHRDLTAVAVWRWVRALRRCDETLTAIADSRTGRARAVISQGDRLVAHIVLGMLNRTDIDDITTDWDDELDRVETLTPTVARLVIEHATKEFGDTYVPTLLKNTGKCRQLVALVAADLPSATRPNPAHSPATPATEPTSSRESIQFHLSSRGVSARGHLRGNGFVVKAGSLAAADAVPSLRANPSAVTRRNWLLDQRVLRQADDAPALLILTRDEYFESPSQASAVMLGRPCNGRTEWRTNDNRSLNEALYDV